MWTLDRKKLVKYEKVSFHTCIGLKTAATVYIFVWKPWSAPLKNWCVPAWLWEPGWWLSRPTVVLTNVWLRRGFYLSGSQSPRVYFSSRPTFGLVEEKTRRLCLCRVHTHHMSWHALVMKRCVSGLSACFCRRRPCWFVHISKISVRFDSFVFQTQI